MIVIFAKVIRGLSSNDELFDSLTFVVAFCNHRIRISQQLCHNAKILYFAHRLESEKSCSIAIVTTNKIKMAYRYWKVTKLAWMQTKP